MSEKRGSRRFEDTALLAKIKKLERSGDGDALPGLIEAAVPEDQLPAWLWSARARGLIPRSPGPLDALLAKQVDRVPAEVLVSALTRAADGAVGEYLPSIPAPSMWLLQACCRAGQSAALRARIGELPLAVQLAVWTAIASVDKDAKVPAEVVAEVARILPAHAASGKMEGLEMGTVSDWLGIAPADLYAPGRALLPSMERIPLVAFGCILFQIPRSELLALLDRLDVSRAQAWWIAWWIGARLSTTDSAADSLAILDALRPALARVSDYFLACVLDEAGLVTAKALVAAGEAVPGWLLEVPSPSDTFIERWSSVHATLPRERLLALRDRLRAILPEHARAQILVMAPLFGPAAIRDAIAATEDAIAHGHAVTNQEVTLLGTIGRRALDPLAARIDALDKALPRDSRSTQDYLKLAVASGLRASLAIALGTLADADEPIDARFDRYLLPSRAVFGTGQDDHVYRFFYSSNHRMRRLFAKLPEPRLAAFVEAWRDFDPTDKHHIAERLAAVIPEDRRSILSAGPSTIERLRRAAAEIGLPCTQAVYALTRDATRRPGALDTLGAQPLGLPPAAIPRAGKKKMKPVLSLDLAEIPELAGRWPGARALCLFVDRPRDGFESSALVALDAAACEAGFSGEGGTFTVEQIMVPPEVFLDDEPAREQLGALRDGLDALGARALGAPSFIQSKRSIDDAEGFILQAGERFTGLNLGDAGRLFLFDTSAFWECS